MNANKSKISIGKKESMIPRGSIMVQNLGLSMHNLYLKNPKLSEIDDPKPDAHKKGKSVNKING